MYEKLNDVILKSGEKMELGVVVGPDANWVERIDGDLLAHKGETWRWGNRLVLEKKLALEAYFYVLHRKGVPFANVMTIEYQGMGILGHVFTKPEDRRKGAASLIFEALMAHFRKRGGQALVLGTGYDSPPYHIYRSFGFEGIEPMSGTMAYYANGETAFRTAYFDGKDTQIERLNASHYAVAPALSSGAYPGVVRSVAMRLFGRSSTEGPFMGLLRDEMDRIKDGKDIRTAVMRLNNRPAVVGFAHWSQDLWWPNTCVIDVFCHPDFWKSGADLLSVLDLPGADRYVAYCDVGWRAKEQVLETAGFERAARLDRWVAKDRAKTGFVNVGVWVKI